MIGVWQAIPKKVKHRGPAKAHCLLHFAHIPLGRLVEQSSLEHLSLDLPKTA